MPVAKLWFGITWFFVVMDRRSINLLPWREKLQTLKKRQFFQVLSLSLGCTIFFLFLINCGLQYHIRNEQLNKTVLQQQFAQLLSQTKLIDRWQQQLQKLRCNLQTLDMMRMRSVQHAKLFEQFAQIMPYNLWLTELYCVNNQLVITGYAETNGEITLFLQQLQNLQNIRQVKLGEIKVTQTNQSYRYRFTIQAGVT